MEALKNEKTNADLSISNWGHHSTAPSMPMDTTIQSKH